MKWTRIRWYIFSAVVLLCSAGWIIASAPGAGTTTAGLVPAPAEGFLAPNFSLAAADGETIPLHDLRGQVVLVNFWASWCGPCQAEMPAMQRAFEEFSQEGFTILAVNMTSQDQQSLALAFASQYGLSFPIVFDDAGSVSQVYRVRALPTSFFVDRNGVIANVVIGGPMPETLLRAEIQQLLEEPR